MCGQRGLLADSDDQTFGMALSRQFRTHYDTIIAPIQAEVHQLHKTHKQRVFWKEGMWEGVKERERNIRRRKRERKEGGRRQTCNMGSVYV